MDFKPDLPGFWFCAETVVRLADVVARVVPGGEGMTKDKAGAVKVVPGDFTEGDRVSLYGLLAIWHCVVSSPPMYLEKQNDILLKYVSRYGV